MSEWFGSFSRVKARKNRWKGPMLTAGVAVHVAMFTGMWAKGIWDIKKVEAAENEITLTTVPNPPSVDTPPPGATKPQMTKPPRRMVKEPVQPEALKVPPVPLPEGPTVGPTGPEVPIEGIITGVPNPQPPQEPIPKVIPPPPLPPVIVKPRLVEQARLERISGETSILPDEATAQRISHDGAAAVRGVLKLCISASGAVDSAVMARSTEFSAYDAKLERETRRWRYQPYRVNGAATPVCTLVTFIYRQR
jgi:hypothetical protein